MQSFSLVGSGRQQLLGSRHQTVSRGLARAARPVAFRRQGRLVASRTYAISAPERPAKRPVVEAADEEDLDGKACDIVLDRDGDFIEVMCCDYGFRSGSGRMYQEQDGRIPFSAWQLGMDNFKQELKALRRSVRYNEYQDIADMATPTRSIPAKVSYWFGQAVVAVLSGLDSALEKGRLLPLLAPKSIPSDFLDQETGQLTSDCQEIRKQLAKLVLSNDAVWERERKREESGGAVPTPWFVKGAYLSLCYLLDVMFDNRPIQRFWFLETVARMPYFSYITMLHLYESFGWWRAGAELRKVHFAEEWNELHHLQIMESLGGDRFWLDRFLGFHSAIVYYWVLCILFLFNPALAYNFSELIEAHAVDTYGEFADANEAILKALPPPLVAIKYYRTGDLYMFDQFQTAQVSEVRRPDCATLHDVFCNIRDDEGEHVKTMKACQDSSIVGDLAARKDAGQ